jgi:hypothetical protein
MTSWQRCVNCGKSHTSLTACRLDIIKLARKYLRELSTGLRASVENPRIYVIFITKIVLRHARETGQNVRPPCYNSDIQTKRKVVSNDYTKHAM